MNDISKRIANELNINVKSAASAVELIDQGNTIPFISRYRKEATGGLNDEVLRNLGERLEYLRKLDARKQEVVRLIGEQGKMTDALQSKISAAQSVTEVDDLYRPYRPKRRTKATIAKQMGLSALADMIWQQKSSDSEIAKAAVSFISAENGVDSIEDAIGGAKDIVAEMISDDAALRKKLRQLISEKGELISKTLTKQSSVYDTYYDFSAPISKLVPHRVLALNRGEKEKILSVKLEMELRAAQASIIKSLYRGRIPGEYLTQAVTDAYKRLIFPSIEREIRKTLTEQADEQATKVFSENLRNLLLAPPVKGKTVMALDPGFRTGNKVAVVDDTGKVLGTGVVYMTLGIHDMTKANDKLKSLIDKHKVDIIAIGNGTASKETESAVAALLKQIDRKVVYMIVNEAGASIYSASKLGTEEFPNFDVALRSAVSIARRLQDPLAELVKIDPKAIGVGQYQHDVNQKHLADTLDGVVEFCVNDVGVDLNTASPSLLKHVSGISTAVANSIVSLRESGGSFSDRKQLKKVPKLGGKAFEQCAGFLRIADGKNILDNTAIHPESYGAVEKLVQLEGYKKTDEQALAQIRSKLDMLDIEQTAKELDIGEMTLADIFTELKKPGRDPREAFAQPVFRSDVMHMEDLKEGMVLTGTVRNVIDFGAFVDIGVHQDGLVHISQLADKFVKHPMDVVKTGDVVKVKVLSIDLQKKRIALSMKNIDKGRNL
ncbi:MAG: RNA-binding transcriptional accessory protein [Clostridia bacterium]|jgi:protein Tex|nr:RNA-binding transcriptional accessory protein [Clostridia bacterium]MBT7122701.1 RNA-binding transcriptional accessory protein [Clostridia bacterium]